MKKIHKKCLLLVFLYSTTAYFCFWAHEQKQIVGILDHSPAPSTLGGVLEYVKKKSPV